MTQNRDKDCLQLCAVEASLDIVELTMKCGAKDLDDSLCLFQSDEGTTVYLAGDVITKYYRHVTQLVFPSISDEKLRLFSCHSLRVKAAVLLHDAGKDDSYIKLRLHWLNECFQVYLQSTKRICEQHNAALKDVNDIILKALVISEVNLP